jgi:thiaminase (transcriptional activator TenA)
MSFTASLWQHVRPIYAAILAHPFIEGLADGTLARERFVFYLQQDALYLEDFSRALAITGSRLSDRGAAQHLIGFAHNVFVVERALHETYFGEYGVSARADKAPACFTYTNYLLATATTAPPHEALAALLPCFWIYREVGRHIVGQSAGALACNPYARWIETYAGTEFDTHVDIAIDIVETAGADVGDAQRAAMQDAFERAARLEWAFWDSAWRREAWPPATAA